LGVSFRVMTEVDRESYLSDVIGHGVTEEERYEGTEVEQREDRDLWEGNSSKYTTTQQD
jgi:hypothetical protein